MSPSKPKLIRRWYNVPGQIYDLSRTREGRCRLTLYGAVGLICFAIGGLIDRTFWTPRLVTPDESKFGWVESVAKAEAPRIAAMMPKFAITDADGNVVSGEGKNAELWRFAKLSNEGKHIATWRQESGDCVSMGASNAIAYRQGFQIAQDQRNEVLKIPFPPYLYGTSRVQIGKRQLGRGAGSIGAWAAQAAISYGVLPADEAARQGFSYSGRLADQWGWQGPPQSTLTYAGKFRIRTVSQVRSWEDVRDALVHGYPVTVASNVGFNGGHYDRDGKRWLKPAGNWGHQMCFIGCEDRPQRTKGAYCLNSWGVDAHPRPLNDEPPGGFWVDWQTVQRMVAQGDSWAFSDFDGFPAEGEADWNAFKTQVEAHVPGEPEAELLARVEQPDPQPVLMEVRTMFDPTVLWSLLAIGVTLAALALMRLYTPKARGASALLIAFALIYGASTIDTSEAGPRRRAARYQASVTQMTHVTQPAATAPCVCPSGACCNGVCANCPAGEGWKCGPNGCVPPKSDGKRTTVTKTKTVETVNATPMDVNVWTALPTPTTPKALRTYADCYEHETDFVLVIGNETDAVNALETEMKPVAYEASQAGLGPGVYHVFEHDGKLCFHVVSPTAVTTSAVEQPMEWSAFGG